MTSQTPYAESLERVRSVLVFFATTGSANAAVLAELESEVRMAVSAARLALLPMPDVQSDLDRLATVTLPPSAAASATRMLHTWVTLAYERSTPNRTPDAPDGLRR